MPRPALRLLAAALLAVACLLAAGCDEGTEARIRERREVFEKLGRDVQKRVIDGIIEVGDSADVVYMAIGAPARMKAKQTSRGRAEMWVYQHAIPTNGVARMMINNPNSRVYVTSMSSPNGPISTVPGRHSGPANSTFSGGGDLIPTLDAPEVEVNTLYVFLLADRVVEIKLATP